MRPAPTLASLAAVLLLAVGCAAPPSVPDAEGLTAQPPADWSERQQRLSKFQHWQLQGKLAVRQAEDSGSAVINRWTQHREQYQISLSSAFLGLGRTDLSGQPGYLELTLADGETYRSTDPDALMLAATGWQLPLANLSWWVRGLPAPEGNFELLFDADGVLAMIRQQGWEIRYDRWRADATDDLRLPARITAVKDNKRVRVVITDWQSLAADQG